MTKKKQKESKQFKHNFELIIQGETKPTLEIETTYDANVNIFGKEVAYGQTITLRSHNFKCSTVLVDDEVLTPEMLHKLADQLKLLKDKAKAYIK